MSNTNSLDGLDELLAGIYVVLKKHEELLFELSASAMALQELLEQRPELASAFQQIRQRLKTGKLGPAFNAQSRLYDEMIQRVRDT